MRTCRHCETSIVWKNAHAQYCSDKCRNYARLRRLRNPIPQELTSRARWLRRNASKVPLTVTGSPASSTDENTWSTFEEAQASKAGVGLGFALGDGIACIDLDHVIENGKIDPRALELIESVEHFYVEESPSGDGLHIWLTTSSPNGRNKYTLENGLGVEWYDHSRYITVTGKKIDL